MAMLTKYDQEILPRCRRLGHEVTFGYCRQENHGVPCRSIFDCWWERFEVRAFLRANLPEDIMAQLESATAEPPRAKVLSLLDLVQQTKERLASAKSDPQKQQGRDLQR